MAMRRKDREKDEAFGLTVMDKATYAVLSLNGPDGRAYSVPLSPGRIGRSIYFHCAPVGTKLDFIRQDPRVRLVFVGDTAVPPPLTEAEYRNYQAEGTLNQKITSRFTVFYESAIADGIAFFVEDETEKTEGLRAICRQQTPNNMKYFEEAVAVSLHRTCVIRVDLETVSAKHKAAPV